MACKKIVKNVLKIALPDPTPPLKNTKTSSPLKLNTNHLEKIWEYSV